MPAEKCPLKALPSVAGQASAMPGMPECRGRTRPTRARADIIPTGYVWLNKQIPFSVQERGFAIRKP